SEATSLASSEAVVLTKVEASPKQSFETQLARLEHLIEPGLFKKGSQLDQLKNETLSSILARVQGDLIPLFSNELAFIAREGVEKREAAGVAVVAMQCLLDLADSSVDSKQPPIERLKSQLEAIDRMAVNLQENGRPSFSEEILQTTSDMLRARLNDFDRRAAELATDIVGDSGKLELSERERIYQGRNGGLRKLISKAFVTEAERANVASEATLEEALSYSAKAIKIQSRDQVVEQNQEKRAAFDQGMAELHAETKKLNTITTFNLSADPILRASRIEIFRELAFELEAFHRDLLREIRGTLRDNFRDSTSVSACDAYAAAEACRVIGTVSNDYCDAVEAAEQLRSGNHSTQRQSHFADVLIGNSCTGLVDMFERLSQVAQSRADAGNIDGALSIRDVLYQISSRATSRYEAALGASLEANHLDTRESKKGLIGGLFSPESAKERAEILARQSRLDDARAQYRSLLSVNLGSSAAPDKNQVNSFDKRQSLLDRRITQIDTLFKLRPALDPDLQAAQAKALATIISEVHARIVTGVRDSARQVIRMRANPDPDMGGPTGEVTTAALGALDRLAKVPETLDRVLSAADEVAHRNPTVRIKNSAQRANSALVFSEEAREGVISMLAEINASAKEYLLAGDITEASRIQELTLDVLNQGVREIQETVTGIVLRNSGPALTPNLWSSFKERVAAIIPEVRGLASLKYSLSPESERRAYLKEAAKLSKSLFLAEGAANIAAPSDLDNAPKELIKASTKEAFAQCNLIFSAEVSPKSLTGDVQRSAVVEIARALREFGILPAISDAKGELSSNLRNLSPEQMAAYTDSVVRLQDLSRESSKLFEAVKLADSMDARLRRRGEEVVAASIETVKEVMNSFEAIIASYRSSGSNQSADFLEQSIVNSLNAVIREYRSGMVEIVTRQANSPKASLKREAALANDAFKQLASDPPVRSVTE
ncbi:MAG: hypothetical protein KDD53_05220, partial [Bdellovibrionales bacterium]|nr:hypothetical protein [Bdellovibrionales bacterium]